MVMLFSGLFDLSSRILDFYIDNRTIISESLKQTLVEMVNYH
jgi:hypothetical protein